LIFNFDKVSQVGIVVRDLEKCMKSYWEEFKIGPWKVWTFAPPVTSETTLYGKPVQHAFRIAEAMVGDLCLELIEHLEGETIHKEFLDKRGEGLHHIQYIRNDIEPALERFRKLGIGVIQSGKVAKDSYYYLDTESRFGIIVELATNFGDFIPPERMYPP
jgi:methylmalonyl-CoA/ethylmalonyl-CoA epimerase